MERLLSLFLVLGPMNHKATFFLPCFLSLDCIFLLVGLFGEALPLGCAF
jgi:hypothetical protein